MADDGPQKSFGPVSISITNIIHVIYIDQSVSNNETLKTETVRW